MAIGVHVYYRDGAGSSFAQWFGLEEQPALIPQDRVGAEVIAEDQIEVAVIVQIADGQARAIGLKHADDAVGGIGDMGQIVGDEEILALRRLDQLLCGRDDRRPIWVGLCIGLAADHCQRKHGGDNQPAQRESESAP